MKPLKLLEKIIKMHEAIFLAYTRMDLITKETYKNGVELIVDHSDILWLNKKKKEERLSHANLPVITKIPFRLKKLKIPISRQTKITTKHIFFR